MEASILAEEKLPAERLFKLLDLVSYAWESSLGLRIRQAAEAYWEVPFSMPATRDEPGLDDEGPDLVCSKVPLIWSYATKRSRAL